MISPVLPRATQIARHFPSSRASGSWKRESTVSSPGGAIPAFKDVDRQAVKIEKLSLTEATSNKSKIQHASVSTPTISENGSNDDGVTVHCDSPVVAHGGSASTSTSPSKRKS